MNDRRLTKELSAPRRSKWSRVVARLVVSLLGVVTIGIVGIKIYVESQPAPPPPFRLPDRYTTDSSAGPAASQNARTQLHMRTSNTRDASNFSISFRFITAPAVYV